MIMIRTKNGYSLTAVDKSPETLLFELCCVIIEVAEDISVTTGKSLEKVFNELVNSLRNVENLS